jgi:hypothetical protein
MLHFFVTCFSLDRDIYNNSAIRFLLELKAEEDAVIFNEILIRAASDPEFRNQLIRQSSNVLAQYNISDEAKSIIENSINDLTQ